MQSSLSKSPPAGSQSSSVVACSQWWLTNTMRDLDKSIPEMSVVISKFSGYLGNDVLSLKSSKLINFMALLSLVSFFNCLRVSPLVDNCAANFPFCGVEEPDPMVRGEM